MKSNVLFRCHPLQKGNFLAKFHLINLVLLQGPLAKVWLAAHERKLTKAQLLQTSITRSTQAIVEQDEAPLALRLSGQLLLGVVRIYSRKARYLLDDCNEALMKIKLVRFPPNVLS